MNNMYNKLYEMFHYPIVASQDPASCATSSTVWPSAHHNPSRPSYKQVIIGCGEEVANENCSYAYVRIIFVR